MNRKFAQNFSIQPNIFLLHLPNEAAVHHTMLLQRSIEPHNPEATEVPLLPPSITVRMLSGLHHSLLRHSHRLAPTTTVAFRLLQELLMSPVTGDASFYTHSTGVKSEKL